MVAVSDVFAGVSAIAVLTGVVIAIDELRHFSKLRQGEVITQIQAHIFDTQFIQNWFLLERMEYKTYAEIRGKPEELALSQWISFLEGLGLMVKRGVIPLEVVDDYFHGVIRLTWEKLKPIVINQREEMRWPEFGEWAEYLYFRIYVRGDLKKQASTKVEEEVYSRRISAEKR